MTEEDSAAGAPRAVVIAPGQRTGEEDQPTIEHLQFRQLMEIERARIDSSNRRTEVVREMVQAQTEQNIREHEFALAKITLDDTSESRRLNIFKVLVYSAGLFGVVVFFLLFYIVFFSNSEYSPIAQGWLSNAFKALAGGSFLLVIGEAIRRLLK
jgi:Fe2+ transport system protein B